METVAFDFTVHSVTAGTVDMTGHWERADSWAWCWPWLLLASVKQGTTDGAT